MGIKYYAAIGNEVPQRILVPILGALDEEDGVYYTRPFDSKHHLLTLIGTVQSRMERENREFDGACILPYGAKVPTRRTKFKVQGPLKARLDYGISESFPILEMRSPYNKFYAAEQESTGRLNMTIMPPNKHYPRGLTEQDIRSYYQVSASKIIAQYNKYDLDGAVLLCVDPKTALRRQASQEIMSMRVEPTAFDRLNRGRTMEFQFIVKGNTKFLWLEVEANEGFPWKETKQVAGDLLMAMSSLDEVNVVKTELRFSGKEGFYVMAHIAHPLEINEAQIVAKRVAERYVNGRGDSRIIAGNARESGCLRVDYGSMCEQGNLRVPYSLTYPTGLMCMAVNPNQLESFEKDMAKIAIQGAEADALRTKIIEQMKLTPKQVEQLDVELKTVSPVDLELLSTEIENVDINTGIKSIHGVILGIIARITAEVNSTKQGFGPWWKFYERRSDYIRPIMEAANGLSGLTEDTEKKIRTMDEIIIGVSTKANRIGALGIIKQDWQHQVGQGKSFLTALRAVIGSLRKRPKGGYEAELARLVAKGENTLEYAQSMAAKLDSLGPLVNAAGKNVPRGTFVGSSDAAVMDYPMTDTIQEESVEELAAQIEILMGQVNRDLDTVISLLQDLSNDLDTLGEPIEAQAAEENKIVWNPSETMVKYGLSPEEMESIQIWLGIRKIKMTAQNIDDVLTVKDRLGGEPFRQLVESLVTNRLYMAPEELDKWVSGLEMLQEMPKYQATEKPDFQTFMKEHKFIPYVGGLVEQQKDPLLRQFSPQMMESVVQMSHQVDPIALARYIDLVMGLKIPIEHIQEFVERLEVTYPMIHSESIKDPMLGWRILGEMKQLRYPDRRNTNV